MTVTIDKVVSHDNSDIRCLASLMVDCVTAGAAIGMVHPFTQSDAEAFWRNVVMTDVENNGRTLFVAREGSEIVGTVQLITAMPPNQAHRCEIAKMMVAPNARRRGIGRQLMTAALDLAKDLEKRTVTLDTRSNDVAEPLYASVGFKVAGEIPDYAVDPDGVTLHATTYMYLAL